MDLKGKAEQYVEEHKIFQLFEDMLGQLILHKPDDPLDFMIQYLSTSHGTLIVLRTLNSIGSKVIVIGPPSSGKSIQCKYLEEKCGLTIISVSELLQSNNSSNSKNNESDPKITTATSDDFILDLIKSKINQPECREKGWALDGFPTTRRQALALQSCGILPDVVFVLEGDENVFRTRASNREDFEKNLTQFNKHIKGIVDCYKNVAEKVDSTQSVDKVSEKLRARVSTLNASSVDNNV